MAYSICMEHSYEERERRSLIEAMEFAAKGVMEAIWCLSSSVKEICSTWS